MRVHVSTVEGAESITDERGFRDAVRESAIDQPEGDGGCKVIENVTILSFDDDTVLTFVVDGTSYTILNND